MPLLHFRAETDPQAPTAGAPRSDEGLDQATEAKALKASRESNGRPQE